MPRPFSSPQRDFEIKYDGYRVLAEIDTGRVRLQAPPTAADATVWFPEIMMSLAATPGHQLLDGEVCVVDELGRSDFERLKRRAGEPMFWFERSRQSAFFDHCQSVFQRHGFAPDAVREPSDHHVLLGQVADGTALALLPRSFMSLRRAGVSYRPLLEGEELAVGLGLAVPSDAPALRDSLMKQTAPLRA